MLADDDIARDHALHLYRDVIDEAYDKLCRNGCVDYANSENKIEFGRICWQFFGSVIRTYGTDESTPRRIAKQIARSMIGAVLKSPTDAIAIVTKPETEVAGVDHASLVKATRDKIANQLVDDVFDQFKSDLNAFREVLREKKTDSGPVLIPNSSWGCDSTETQEATQPPLRRSPQIDSRSMDLQKSHVAKPLPEIESKFSWLGCLWPIVKLSFLACAFTLTLIIWGPIAILGWLAFGYYLSLD